PNSSRLHATVASGGHALCRICWNAYRFLTGGSEITPRRSNSTKLFRQLISCRRPLAFRHPIHSQTCRDNCRREISDSALPASPIRFSISLENSRPPTLTTPRLYEIIFAVSTTFCG